MPALLHWDLKSPLDKQESPNLVEYIPYYFSNIACNHWHWPTYAVIISLATEWTLMLSIYCNWLSIPRYKHTFNSDSFAIFTIFIVVNYSHIIPGHAEC